MVKNGAWESTNSNNIIDSIINSPLAMMFVGIVIAFILLLIILGYF